MGKYQVEHLLQVTREPTLCLCISNNHKLCRPKTKHTSHNSCRFYMKRQKQKWEHILVSSNLYAFHLSTLLISDWYPIALTSFKLNIPKMWCCIAGNASIILFLCFKQCQYVLLRPSHSQCTHIALAYLHQHHHLCLACTYDDYIFSCPLFYFLALLLLGLSLSLIPFPMQSSMSYICEGRILGTLLKRFLSRRAELRC